MPPNRPVVQAVAPKLVFTGGKRGKIASDRIQLLDAIRRNGSISKAAKVLGLSYKAAWDAVIAMNNLFPSPLVERQTGGKRGGGAILTPRGEAVISAMREAMASLDRFAKGLIEEGVDHLANGNLWSMMMKTTARNSLHATIESIRPGAVNAEVRMDIGGETLVAIVTRGSIERLGLNVGAPVTVLIKASFIILASPETAGSVSARNQIKGRVTHIEPGSVNTEILLDIGGGKTLTAIVTEASAQKLGYKKGDELVALIKASHIIVGME